MASSEVNAKIIGIFSNADGANTFDINDIYAANLITNHGYHHDAKNMIAQPPRVEIEEVTYDDPESYINIRIPFSVLPYNEGDEVDLAGIHSSLSSAGIYHGISTSDEFNYALGETTTFGSNGLGYPTGEWCESRNGHLTLCFEYEKETFEGYFTDANYREFVFSHDNGSKYVLFAFEKVPDGKIVFVKGAVVEPIT